MVVPIRDLGNKFTSTTSNTSPMLTFELPTVSFASNTGMDFLSGPSSDNYDEVRGRPLSTNKNISRDSSMSSMRSSVIYHERMDHNNAMVIDDDMNDITPALSYKDEQEKALQVSKAAEHQDNMRLKDSILNISKSIPQCVLNEEQCPGPTYGPTMYNENNNIINIQLLYNS